MSLKDAVIRILIVWFNCVSFSWQRGSGIWKMPHLVAVHRLMTLEVVAVRMRNEIIWDMVSLAFFTSCSRLGFSAKLNEFNETIQEERRRFTFGKNKSRIYRI